MPYNRQLITGQSKQRTPNEEKTKHPLYLVYPQQTEAGVTTCILNVVLIARKGVRVFGVCCEGGVRRLSALQPITRACGCAKLPVQALAIGVILTDTVGGKKGTGKKSTGKQSTVIKVQVKKGTGKESTGKQSTVIKVQAKKVQVKRAQVNKVR